MSWACIAFTKSKGSGTCDPAKKDRIPLVVATLQPQLR
jgi:hypothetical protein